MIITLDTILHRAPLTFHYTLSSARAIVAAAAACGHTGVFFFIAHVYV